MSVWLSRLPDMRRVDRVPVIQRIASRLDAVERDDLGWGEADPVYEAKVENARLMLRQYDLSLPESGYHGSGRLRDRVIYAIEDAHDEVLLELDEFVSSGAVRTLVNPADLPWASGTLRLFVSHTHANAELAAEIRKYMIPWGIDAFVAHETIVPPREWQRVIEASLRTCDALVALATPDFRESDWCDQEVGYCLGRPVPVVAVRLGADPHGFIAKYQAVRIAPLRSSADGWSATLATDGIFRALAQHPDLADAMVPPTVRRFAATRGPDGARANLGLIQSIPAEKWTRELVEITERALNDNWQLLLAKSGSEPNSPTVDVVATELLGPIKERLGMNEPASVGTATSDDIPF